MPIGAKILTTVPIFRQLTTLALPILATNFVQMAYSLTDMAWVGRLGSGSIEPGQIGREAVAAVGAVGLLLWLVSSFAMLSKVAAEVSVGQSIGAGHTREAMAFASHTTTISLITALMVMGTLFFGANFILSFFKLDVHIAQDAKTYLYIVASAIPFAFLSLNFSGIYNGMGRSNIPFLLNASGLVCNMILDPILILGIGSFKGFGIQGAAIATWISQALVFTLFLWQLRRHNGILNRFPLVVKLRRQFSGRILQLGSPIAVMTLLFAFINMYMARVASIYGGHLGVSTQTAGGQIEGITWNTSLGFSTALGAFVAQNYAANKMGRAIRAYRYTLILMLTLGIGVTVAFRFFGYEVFGVLIPEREAQQAGAEYLYIMAYSQIFMMLELTTQGMFNGMGKTLPPAIVSVFFNLARIPLALLFASQMGISGVWWAITISSIMKGALLPLWFFRETRKNPKL